MSDNQNELDKLFGNYEGDKQCKEFDTGYPVGCEYSPEVCDIAIEEIAKLISDELTGHKARLQELKKLRAAVYSGDGDAIKKVLAMAKENRKTTGESSPEISWSEYKKTIFSPEEIAAVDAKVAKMSKKIEKKQRRRRL